VPTPWPVDKCLFQKLEHFKVAFPLPYAYYHFVKSHKTIQCAPAVEAGVETSAWTVQNIIGTTEA